MIKGMRRECPLFLAVCVFIAALCCCHVEAAENTEFDLMEDAESPPDESVLDIPLGTGILMVENLSQNGILEIVCSIGTFTVEWDYSDMEMPLGEACVLRVTAHEGYVVDRVLLDGELLEPGEDGSYILILKNEMSELVVSYAVSGTPPASGEELPGDAGEDSRDEQNGREKSGTDEGSPKAEVPGGDAAAEPADSSGRKFASDISYDITVSYEDEDETPIVIGARTPAGEDSYESAGADDIEPVPEPAEAAEDPGSADIREAAEETEESTGGEHIEDEETVLAGLPEKPDESASESADRPAAVNMAAVPELREPEDAVPDRSTVVVLLAGAALAMLSAHIVKKHGRNLS